MKSKQAQIVIEQDEFMSVLNAVNDQIRRYKLDVNILTEFIDTPSSLKEEELLKAKNEREFKLFSIRQLNSFKNKLRTIE